MFSVNSDKNTGITNTDNNHNKYGTCNYASLCRKFDNTRRILRSWMWRKKWMLHPIRDKNCQWYQNYMVKWWLCGAYNNKWNHQYPYSSKSDSVATFSKLILIFWQDSHFSIIPNWFLYWPFPSHLKQTNMFWFSLIWIKFSKQICA